MAGMDQKDINAANWWARSSPTTAVACFWDAVALCSLRCRQARGQVQVWVRPPCFTCFAEVVLVRMFCFQASTWHTARDRSAVRPGLRATPSLSLWRHAVMVSSFLAACGAALEITRSVVQCPVPTKACGVQSRQCFTAWMDQLNGSVELMGSFLGPCAQAHGQGTTSTGTWPPNN